MDKFIVTEVFGDTIQGEGKYVGTPSIFVRFFGCTLHCPGFSMPRGEKTTEVDKIVETLDEYSDDDLKRLPLCKTGCDSYPAWRKECRRFSKEYTAEELCDIIYNLVPITCRDTIKHHVVFTGGEPLLYQELLPKLMYLLMCKGFTYFTFETNGTVGLTDRFIADLNAIYFNKDFKITWSCRPKLSISGHSKEETLFPDKVRSFNNITGSELYFKYVIRDEKDIAEVTYFTASYKGADVEYEEIYLMPEGGTVCNETSLTEQETVKLCIKYGYRYSPRLHLQLFGNKWGK